MKARDYTYSVAWSDEDNIFIGRAVEFPSVTAHGRTPEAALREIMMVVGDVIAELKAACESIPEPIDKRQYSGKFVLRLPVSLHRDLVLEAGREGVSLNQLIALKLRQAHAG